MMLEGICTITVTPFDEQGNIDEQSLRKLTDFYIDAGVHGMTILGIMGEAHKITDEERQFVIKTVIEQTGERVPIVVGCTAQGTKVAATYAKNAEAAGAAAVMIAPPRNLRNEDMLIQFFKGVASEISIPIVLQDEPVTTHVFLSPQFISRLCDEVENIKYIKLEEAPTTVKTTKILELTGDKLKVLGGLGGVYFYEELARGAVGIMTGFAYPEILVETYNLYKKADKLKARDYFYKYLPLIRFEAQLGIGGVTIRKEAFKVRNIIESSHVRFPGAAVDLETINELNELINYLELTSLQQMK